MFTGSDLLLVSPAGIWPVIQSHTHSWAGHGRLLWQLVQDADVVSDPVLVLYHVSVVVIGGTLTPGLCFL